MKFKNCQFEGDEYICIASLSPNEVSYPFLSRKEDVKQAITKQGDIQIKMNVC